MKFVNTISHLHLLVTCGDFTLEGEHLTIF